MVFLLKIGNRLRSTTSSASLLRRYSLPAKDDAREKDKLEMIDQRMLPTDYDPSNFDPTEHRTPPSERVWGLVDEVSALTLEEVAELSGILMRKAGLSEPPVIGIMKPGTAFLGASAAGAGSVVKEVEKPEKTSFELKLESFESASKIKVIKEVRAFTDLGLKEAKELVEKTPTVIKIGVSKEEAEQIIEKMKGAGAKVIME